MLPLFTAASSASFASRRPVSRYRSRSTYHEPAGKPQTAAITISGLSRRGGWWWRSAYVSRIMTPLSGRERTRHRWLRPSQFKKLKCTNAATVAIELTTKTETMPQFSPAGFQKNSAVRSFALLMHSTVPDRSGDAGIGVTGDPLLVA